MFKKIVYTLVASWLFVACKNGTDHSGHEGHNAGMEPKTKEDSLYKDVMDGHNVVMPKIGKVKGYIALASQQLDSINKLPAKAKAAAAGYKASLDSLVAELTTANQSMTQWMDEFNPDSLSEEVEKRIGYLESEKVKVEKVKSNILGSLEKAEKLFGKKQ